MQVCELLGSPSLRQALRLRKRERERRGSSKDTQLASKHPKVGVFWWTPFRICKALIGAEQSRTSCVWLCTQMYNIVMIRCADVL